MQNSGLKNDQQDSSNSILLTEKIEVESEAKETNTNNYWPYSSLVIIVLFIVERLLKRNERKKDWYLNVIIGPHLEKINKFYFDIKIVTEEQSQKLIELERGEVQLPLFIKEKAISNRKIKERIGEFRYDVLLIFNSFKKETAENLFQIILELEDEIINHFDCIGAVEQMDTSDTEFIQNNKLEFFSTLYRPISKKKASKNY